MAAKRMYCTLTDLEEAQALGADRKNTLGGKGAGVFDMTLAGLPVPPAITITTEQCNEYLGMKHGNAGMMGPFVEKLVMEVMENLGTIEGFFGYRPLVSVRSGARVSMPGMMDTILNVGLTEDTLPEWKERIGERAALDSYRRLMQMYGSVVFEIPHYEFEYVLSDIKEKYEVTEDSALDVCALIEIISGYKDVISEAGSKFPSTIEGQLIGAIKAVFHSWNNERAITYRKLNNIPQDWGTAVTVQAMVFGNLNDKSCSGVLFTRCPSTGEPKVVGEFLPNAQGEDVVAGIRTPLPIDPKFAEWGGGALAMELGGIVKSLEAHYKDMQDVEFTVQDGKLYILQTRNAKRAPQAAFKVAYDLYTEGLIAEDVMFSRVTGKQYLALLNSQIDPTFNTPPDLTGIAAGGGLVRGLAVFSSQEAVDCKEPCILVAKETTPEDISGMNAAVGILTSTGGLTSHAAVVARGMNKTCVVGAMDMVVDKNGAGISHPVAMFIHPHSILTMDGATGRVWVDIDVPVIQGTMTPEAQAILKKLISRYSPLFRGEVPTPLVSEVYVDSAVYEEDISLMIENIHRYLAEGDLNGQDTRAIVDLTHMRSHLQDPDKALLDMFSVPASPLPLLKSKVEALVQLDATYVPRVRVVMPKGVTHYKQTLTQQGFEVIGAGDSLKDLLQGSGCVTMAPEVFSKLFVDLDTFNEFRAVMKAAGRELGILPNPTSLISFIFEHLGTA